MYGAVMANMVSLPQQTAATLPPTATTGLGGGYGRRLSDLGIAIITAVVFNRCYARIYNMRYKEAPVPQALLELFP